MIEVEYRLDLVHCISKLDVWCAQDPNAKSGVRDAALDAYSSAAKAAPKLRLRGRIPVAADMVSIHGERFHMSLIPSDDVAIVVAELRLVTHLHPSSLEAKVQALRAAGWTDQ